MPRVDCDQVRRALASRAPAPVSEPVRSRAAVAVILREGTAGFEVLFIRRAEQEGDPWSGQMSFPGGRAEPGEDLPDTAMRETREETAIDLARDGERLGQLDEVRAMARMRPMDLAITPFVFRLRSRGDTVIPSEEVRSAHWLSLDGLISPAAHSTMEYAYQGTTLEFPCLRWDGLVIWGLTYRMFTNFQKLLEAAAGQGADGDAGLQRVRLP
jgi:8-oxo-dGTP pyrophosphatase MutT (NUDIX family)